jgi:K+-transporting ATPase ATPase C chain
MKALNISLRYLLFMTLFLGGLYPLLIFGLGQALFPFESNGSITPSGSELLAQKFSRPEYFWSRPSAVDYNTAAGGASQKSVTDKKLREDVLARIKMWGENSPTDLLYTSASGLDPHLTLQSVLLQKHRVLESRKINEAKLNDLIKEFTEERFLGFMGQPRVNVFKLNLSLDKNN